MGAGSSTDQLVHELRPGGYRGRTVASFLSAPFPRWSRRRLPKENRHGRADRTHEIDRDRQRADRLHRKGASGLRRRRRGTALRMEAGSPIDLKLPAFAWTTATSLALQQPPLSVGKCLLAAADCGHSGPCSSSSIPEPRQVGGAKGNLSVPLTAC